MTEWIRGLVVRVLAAGLAGELRRYPGVGAAARVWLGGGTLEQILSSYATCTPLPVDGQVVAHVHSAIELYSHVPARDALPAPISAVADVLAQRVAD